MSLCLVYDDRLPVSDDIHALLGVTRFSSVLYRKRTLLEHLQTLMREVDVPEFLHLSRADDMDEWRRRLERAPAGQRFLYYPSHIVPTNLGEARTFLKKIQFSRRDLLVSLAPGDAPILLIDEAGLRAVMNNLADMDWAGLTRNASALPVVRGSGVFRDIAGYDRFVEFLSSNFDVRHFNTIEHDDLTVHKRSQDAAKMRREFRFLSMVEGPVSAFFMRPFDFHEEPGSAGYRLERLNVPDMALQWVHGAFSPDEFSSFMGRIERFFAQRATRDCDPAAFRTLTDDLYAGKVRDRLTHLKALPGYARFAMLLQTCTPHGSVDALADRWDRLFARLRPRLGPPRLAFTHGDLCFSNILYDRRIRFMKFIDPRGADTPDELFSHPYYDAAKLSHSVLGGYDFINHALFDLALDADLSVAMEPSRPERATHDRIFSDSLARAGFDLDLVRLFEASLFLSMLPLHIDVPRKTLALALRAASIIELLEGGTDSILRAAIKPTRAVVPAT